MKQLLLIRHGKSSWGHPGLTDHERPLNDRGERDAPRMAVALGQRGVKPDVVISSTAVRAAETARRISDGLGFSRDSIQYTESAYLASPGTILQLVQQIDESADMALLFGHNPGMHEAVNGFAKGDSVYAFPTLGVGRLELDIEYWGEADWDCGLLLELLVPSDLDED